MCARGADCWFYHSEEDRLPLIGYKGQLCRAWQVSRGSAGCLQGSSMQVQGLSASCMQCMCVLTLAGGKCPAAQETGSCPAGAGCNYAHGGSELIMDLGHAFQERQVEATEAASTAPPSPTSTDRSRSTDFHDAGAASRWAVCPAGTPNDGSEAQAAPAHTKAPLAAEAAHGAPHACRQQAAASRRKEVFIVPRSVADGKMPVSMPKNVPPRRRKVCRAGWSARTRTLLLRLAGLFARTG